jgi:hypothetical protein
MHSLPLEAKILVSLLNPDPMNCKSQPPSKHSDELPAIDLTLVIVLCYV